MSETNEQVTVQVIDIPASFADFALACGLAHDASKADILAKMGTDKVAHETAKADVAKFLEALGVSSVDAGLGAVEAGKTAVDALAAERAQRETLEMDKLISDARAAKKLTPHMEAGLEGKSLDFVRSFLAILQPNPVLAAEEPEQPNAGSSSPTHGGKTWGEMGYQERADLMRSNRALYDALKAAAEKAAEAQ